MSDHHSKAARPHGRTKYVIEKCRCGVCRAANREYMRWLNKQHAYGRPRYVDAEPARLHIEQLMAAGLGLKRIAALSGVPQGGLSKLMYGNYHGRPPSKRIRQDTADKLASVSAHQRAAGVCVDSTGTQRRLHALVAIGWSQSKLGHMLHIAPRNMPALVYGRNQVLLSTERAVRQLYEQLWDTPPPQATHHDKIAASRSRRYARDHGWVPPMAWDDETLDDPQARPASDVDVPSRTGRYRKLPPPDEVRFLLSAGESIGTLAQRYQVNEDTVEHALQR